MSKPIITFFCLFFFTATVQAVIKPPESYLLKQKLIQYYNSGRYHYEFNQAIADAKKCLEQQIHSGHTGKKPSLVLDIDDTALSLYYYGRVLGFGAISSKEFESIIETTNQPAIPATLNLYGFAKKHGLFVFFISGRHESWRAATIRNLQAAGYKNWDGLYLRPDNYSYPSAIPFKFGTRKLLRSEGYKIIGSIGDQLSDLAGDDDIQCKFKLPNPYYFIAGQTEHFPLVEHVELE